MSRRLRYQVAVSSWRITLAVLVMTALGSGAWAHAVESTPAPPDPLEHIPSNWIDLPEAPFVAEMRKAKAVLVNRAKTTFNTVGTGCVTERDGAVHIVRGLFGHHIFDSDYRPGQSVEGLLRMVNNIDYYIARQCELTGRTDLIDRCPTGSRIAVVSAGRRGEHEWSAAGTPWPK